MNQPTITPTDNGPYLVQGTVTLLDADGRPYEASEPVSSPDSTPVCEPHT